MKPVKKIISPTLKTPQSLIHVKHNMTLVQYKYWILFLHDVKRQIDAGNQPDSSRRYYIGMDDVIEMMGVKTTQKKSIIFEDLRKLKDLTVTYNVLEKDGQVAKVGHGFISEWSVSNSRIGYILPQVFIDAMLGLDSEAKNIFQLLNWEVFNSFNGKYEAIIYKLCKDYVGIGKTPYFTVQEYREYIGLKNDEYTAMDNFTRRCVVHPVNVINESIVADIRVSVQFERQGRKVLGLRFLIEAKQLILPIDEEAPKTDAFNLAKITIPVGEQLQYLQTMKEEEIIATIERANEYAESLTKRQKKANMGAIYKTAFSDRWGVQYKEQKALQAKIEQEKKMAQTKTRATQTETERTEQAQKEQNEKLWAEFKAMPESERTRIIEAVQNKSQAMKTQYNKYGEDGALFRSNIIVLLKKEQGITGPLKETEFNSR
jgi:hypothetical protein